MGLTGLHEDRVKLVKFEMDCEEKKPDQCVTWLEVVISKCCRVTRPQYGATLGIARYRGCWASR